MMPVQERMIAGIWEESEYKGDRGTAFAILTDEPNGLIAAYHDRMPLALADDKVDAWLGLAATPTPDAGLLLALTPSPYAPWIAP